MTEHVYPALFALFVWWFSTGVIMYLDGLPQRTFRWSMLGATVILGICLWGLADTANDATVRGAYLAFTCGLLVWGWQEMAFFMGYITGPRREPCPEDSSGWRRFGHALQACLWHELAILVAAVAVLWLTWGGANQIGAWTFLMLLGMKLSAKLNVFLGVRNLNEEFLPEHLSFLKSYLTEKPMNLLFPISVTISTAIAVILGQKALAADASSFEAAGYTFLTVLLALAILEHWLLVLPLPAAALWHWSLASRKPNQRSATEVRDLERMVQTNLTGEEVSSLDHDQGDTYERGHDHHHDGNSEVALGLKSWSTGLVGSFDASRLRQLLEKIVAGDFGEVERVKGIARAGGGWVQFGVAGGRTTMSAFAARDDEEPRVVAIGKSVDEDGLKAAFQTAGAEPALA
ncbi:MAG: putative photosynthetic complex assembly protein PuhE [Pseudomonadota bacterium]